MASARYNQWVATVRAASGRVTVAPSGTPSAAYPMEVWGPRANAKEWPLPNEYRNQTGYYHAPADIAAEARTFGKATAAETEQAGKQLMTTWGVPKPLQSLSNYFGTLKDVAMMLIVGGLVYLAVKRKS